MIILLQAFIMDFLHLVLVVAPYFFLGTACGAALETYLPENFGRKYLTKGGSSVFFASTLGAILPGCACASMPMAESLKFRGVKLGTLASFILVAPLLGPHTLVLTYGLLGAKFTVYRLLFSMIAAMIIGLLFNFMEAKKVKGFKIPEDKVKQDHDKSCCSTEKSCHDDHHAHHKRSKYKDLWFNFKHMTMKLGGYFILGLAIASLLSTIVPPTLIPKYVGDGFFAYILASLIGIPVYICEGEEVPLTAGLIAIGLAEGPAFSFMLGAVGTCIPTILMAQNIIGRRPTFIYAAAWLIFAPLSGWLFSLI